MSDTNSEFRPESGEDWWAVGELFSLAVDQLSAPVEGMHRAIADRWLGLAGESADPVRRGYDTVTKTVYSAVRIGGRALGAVVPMMASLIGRKHTASEQPGSHITSGLRAWANGLWGDELEERGSKLAVPMSFCDAGGTQVDPTPSSTAKAFPNPTGDVVVLLHGLGESERSWHSRTDVHPDLADVLAAESLVPVFVRYNTGRHVSDNGAQLADLLDQLESSWPVPVHRISFVCHSMGGLVARSAIAAGRSASHGWAARVAHLVTLGTPHLGSPLEKGANLLAWGLDVTPETRPLGDFLRGRSVGIKDLRFGSTSEHEWAEVDPDTLLNAAIGDVAPPSGVSQHFIAGVVTKDESHPVGALLGDLVVRVGSATGKGRQRRVESSDALVVGRQRHFDLPTDPEVHKQVAVWLLTDPV